VLSNVKIAYKIYIAAGIQFALVVLVGLIGIIQMGKIGAELSDIAEEDIPLNRALTLLTQHQLEQTIVFERTVVKSLLVEKGHTEAKAELDALTKELKSLSAKVETEINSAVVFVDAALDKPHSQEAVKKYKKIGGALKEIELLHDDIAKKNDALLEMISVSYTEEASTLIQELEALQDDLDHKLIDTVNEIQDFTLKAALQAEHDEQSGFKQIIAVFIVSIALSLIVPFLIGHSITKPIKTLKDRLQEISVGDGDLTMALDDSANDETGDVARSFNLFLQKLRGIITNVNESAKVLGVASEEAISVMGETVDNVQKQYSETEVVANAVSEMSETINSVAKSTSDAAVVSDSVKQRVDEGKAAASETHTIIKQLAGEMEQASGVIEALAEETNNIGSVLDTIRAIAEQTNLLALNAAIEAARAGDTGRGFAVVADEVRSLAQRTQTSTGDIQALVEGLQKEATNAVSSIKKGNQSTEMCLSKSVETTEAFQDASHAVSEISDLNLQIATAAEEQSVVSQQINDSLTSIKHIAEITNEGAQKTSASNQNIAEKVIELHTNLNQFQV